MGTEQRLTDLEKMAKENHDFWHKPTVGGQTRAQRLDRLLALSENAKFSAKLTIWIAGGALTVIGAWTTIQRFLEGVGR